MLGIGCDQVRGQATQSTISSQFHLRVDLPLRQPVPEHHVVRILPVVRAGAAQTLDPIQSNGGRVAVARAAAAIEPRGEGCDGVKRL